MNSLAMRKCSRTVIGVFVACLAFAAQGATNVFNDAVFWFRGGKDIGGDGYMQKGDFFDDLHANDSTHENHKMPMTGFTGAYSAFATNAVFRNEQVVFPAPGSHIAKETRVRHISNAAKSKNYYPFVVNPRSVLAISGFSLGDAPAADCAPSSSDNGL